MGKEIDGKKITIEDVAKALGVSKTTVSRAISGKGRVGSATREMVKRYIEEHDYVPNAQAKALAKQKTYNIGITVPEDFELSDLPFFQKCLIGVCERAGKYGYDVVVSMTSQNDISHLERMINNRKVDGVILTRTLTKDLTIEYLKTKNIPFVTIGTPNDRDVVQVDHDHTAACRELTKSIAAGGPEKIVLLGGDQSYNVTQCRLRGFLQGMHDCGRTVFPDQVILNMGREAEFDEVIDRLIEEQVDCIMCMDDFICLSVLENLRKRKVDVPGDIKVASFYNSRVLEKNIPSITSLNFDARALGSEACSIVMAMINGEEVAQSTPVGYEVYMRESTN
ncbi:MAG: LacI family transcriptional regulator [Lachnospiraceae bacterium]|nr:LacI family transcriptional regulator [Lachnospiraceae bacterium]